MNSLFIDVPSPGEKLGKCLGTSRGPGCRVRITNHAKPREARVWSARDGKWRATKSLKAKVVNEAAVVELTRRRYSQNKIYVSNILAARARFLSNSCLIAAAWLLEPCKMQCHFAKLRLLSSKMLLSVQLQTAIGDILLSVNPFKSLPIFGSQVSVRFLLK